MTMELRSPAFNDHTPMTSRFSYEGGNISPPLQWAGVPDGTEELVLICQCPDAPGEPLTHWVVTNIPPDTTGVAEGALPAGGVPGRNGLGAIGWAGPWPPARARRYRYVFCLYASDARLGLGRDVTSKAVDAALDGHIIGRGSLVAEYAR